MFLSADPLQGALIEPACYCEDLWWTLIEEKILLGVWSEAVSVGLGCSGTTDVSIVSEVDFQSPALLLL